MLFHFLFGTFQVTFLGEGSCQDLVFLETPNLAVEPLIPFITPASKTPHPIPSGSISEPDRPAKRHDDAGAGS